MTEVVTSAQMRAIEAAAIAKGSVTGLELMERAGAAVVAAVFAEWPELAGGAHRAVVLCGPGNNGGDGFVVARLLKAAGWAVDVFLYGDAAKLPLDARVNYERWRGMGKVAALSFPNVTGAEGERFGDAVFGISQTALLVDALFGIGLTRPVAGLHPLLTGNDIYATFGDLMPVRFVSVDMPTGICADSGRVLRADPGAPMPWDAFQAALTVTFHALKPGHLLADGPEYCCKVVVADIGLVPLAAGSGKIGLDLVGRPDTARLSKRSGHKYSHGHALILSGGVGRGGAARLAARGALRIGAGLVTLGCPPSALTENAARLDAVMLRPVKDAAALAGLLTDARINALCLGPGLGVERAAALLALALRESGGSGGGKGPGPEAGAPKRARRAVVIDADGLTALAGDAALFGLLHDGCVLTPHGGEFARLFPDLAARLEAPAQRGPAFSKVDATREAAARAGCVVLCKGPDTVIADPAGRCSINPASCDRAAPWLATAGSGDVLAGLIAGLLARGFSPFTAAETAAWLHTEAALLFGPGLIAEDLADLLPQVLRRLLDQRGPTALAALSTDGGPFL